MNKHVDNGEVIRRISIAVAEWLCGTLEGSADDNEDINCAEALDRWLRFQKKNMETLFIGSFTCPDCNKVWEGLTLSEDKSIFHCPNCGSVQKIASRNSESVRLPQNIDNLKKVQQDTNEIVQKIGILNNWLLKSNISH